MEEAELVKERLQAITVSLPTVITHGSGCLQERQPRCWLPLPLSLCKWKNRTVILHGHVSAALLTLVTTLCNSWASDPQNRVNVLDCCKNSAYVLNSNQKLLRQFGSLSMYLRNTVFP